MPRLSRQPRVGEVEQRFALQRADRARRRRRIRGNQLAHTLEMTRGDGRREIEVRNLGPALQDAQRTGDVGGPVRRARNDFRTRGK